MREIIQDTQNLPRMREIIQDTQNIFDIIYLDALQMDDEFNNTINY